MGTAAGATTTEGASHEALDAAMDGERSEYAVGRLEDPVLALGS